MNTTKKLSIIIPQYNEDEKTVRRLLNSIDLQVGIDFDEIEVIIVNDCNEKGALNESAFSFDFDLRFLATEKNGGCGLAREYGIERCNGEYYTCIDADDTLFSCSALSAMVACMDGDKADYGSFNFYEETHYDNGKLCLYAHRKDTTWCHGKIFRKATRDKLGIHFHEKLRVHEDGYYNTLWLNEKSTVCRCYDLPVYLWRNNPDSTVREKQSLYKIASIETWIDAQDYAVEEMERRKVQGIPNIAFNCLAHIFTKMQCEYWNDERSKEYRVATLRRLKKYIDKYNHYLDRLTIGEKYAVLNEQASGNVEAVIDKPQTFDAWLQEIKNV